MKRLSPEISLLNALFSERSLYLHLLNSLPRVDLFNNPPTHKWLFPTPNKVYLILDDL